ncbi:MAG TPA: DUF397 domain-containing protein [Streptosporangiaceae bacterium]|nr:DUF397 domain-containing protein [Streptosporangiaceae bacterium]
MAARRGVHHRRPPGPPGGGLSGHGRAGHVAVRDSKDPDGPKLVTSPTAWQAFTATVKAGLPL